jgi:hypothetical protein
MFKFDKEKKRLVIGTLVIPYPTKDRLIQDLIGNAISYGIAIMVSSVLHHFFAVKSFRNLWGIIGKKKGKVMIDSDTYEWLDWTLTFIVGLFVFTIVDHAMDYFVEWLKKQKEAYDLAKEKEDDV